MLIGPCKCHISLCSVTRSYCFFFDKYILAVINVVGLLINIYCQSFHQRSDKVLLDTYLYQATDPLLCHLIKIYYIAYKHTIVVY